MESIKSKTTFTLKPEVNVKFAELKNIGVRKKKKAKERKAKNLDL